MKLFVESKLGKMGQVLCLEDDEENPHHDETEYIIILDDDGDEESIQDGETVVRQRRLGTSSYSYRQ